MICQEILEKKLLFISGKGGVGKSVIASTLASIAARQGKRTLLVELDTIETIPQIFGLPGGEHYKEINIADNLSCFHINGKSGLQEYLSLVLKSKRVVQKITQSPIYEYFVNIAPGLKELMAVGKLWDLDQKCLPGTKDPLYDLIIVDTPATGHTLSYLQMPMTAVNTAKKGFVTREAKKVVDLLQDPERTSFNIVTTLAEMPINEATELYEKVSFKLQLPIGCLFINQVTPPFFSGPDARQYTAWEECLTNPDAEADSEGFLLKEKLLLDCAKSWQLRRRVQEEQLHKADKTFSCKTLLLPFLPKAQKPNTLIQKLAENLEDPEAERRLRGQPES